MQFMTVCPIIFFAAMPHSKTINEIFSQGNDLDFLTLELESALLDCKKGTLLQFISQVKEALGNLTIIENAIKGVAALDLAASLRIFDDFETEYLDILEFTLKVFDLDIDMNMKRELLSSICNLILVTKTSLKATILRKIFYLVLQLLGVEALELEPNEVLIFQRYLLRIPKIMASESSQLINLTIKNGFVLAPILVAVDSIITDNNLSISTQCSNSMIYIHCLYTQSFAYKPEELTPRLPMIQAKTVYDGFCLVKDFEIYTAILCLIIKSSLANSVNFGKIISVLKLYLKSILDNDSIGITVSICIHNLLLAIFTRLPSELIQYSQEIGKIVLNTLKYCLSHKIRNFGDHRLLAVKAAIQFRCTILSVQSSKSQFDNILLEDLEDSSNRYLTELSSPNSMAPTREGIYVLGLLKG